MEQEEPLAQDVGSVSEDGQFSLQSVAWLLQHLPAGTPGKKGLPNHPVLLDPASHVAQQGLWTHCQTPALE